MQKNKAPETTPWLIIKIMLPTIPCTLPEKIPIVTIPMWPTEEYAIIFLRSTCCNVVKEA